MYPKDVMHSSRDAKHQALPVEWEKNRKIKIKDKQIRGIMVKSDDWRDIDVCFFSLVRWNITQSCTVQSFP